MAYTPTEWKTGDIVTADKLNKLENGLANVESGGGALFVNATYDSSANDWTMDKTAGEILTALNGGKIVWVVAVDENNVGSEFIDGRKYLMSDFGYSQSIGQYVLGLNVSSTFNALSLDDYPILTSGK